MAGNKGTPAAIEVEGAPQLRRAFKKLGGRSNDLSAIHDDIADIVADGAEQLVPRMDTGTLRHDPRHARARRGPGAGRREGIEPYAGPIHFGWRERNIEPQPFLYDALDDRRGDDRSSIQLTASGSSYAIRPRGTGLDGWALMAISRWTSRH